jgi:UDP-GlcNAc:undecaprenyl-phosphate/decaprenyl-phosphate GlcNAc-1-phosphate transferase
VQLFKPGDWSSVPPVVLTLLNGGITLFWVVGITNAYNFIDSMDGIVAGIGSVVFAFILLVMLTEGDADVLRLLALVLGISVGTLFFNTTPARFFFGDSGAQTIGFLVAAVSILLRPGQHPQESSWFVPILLSGVAIFDTTLVTISRLRRGQPIYHAGHNHTYHRLIQRGFARSHAVSLMHIASIALGCIAFVAVTLVPLYANLLFGGILIVALLLIFYLDTDR